MSGFVANFLRHTRPALLAACVCLSTVAPLRAAEPVKTAAKSPDALIDRVLAAYGGKVALAKVKAYRMEGSVSSVMRGNGALVRIFARPDRLKITLDYPNHPETRILDRSKGWRSDGKGNLSPSDDFLLTSMVLQAARADIPWILDERRATIKLLAPMDGVLFSFREANFASHQSTGETVLTRVVVNPAHTDKDFRP